VRGLRASFWRGRRVFVTGHTGFKGGWLSLWLSELGARVRGYSLPPPTRPSLFSLARLGEVVEHQEGDVLDLAALRAAIADFRPDVVFHLAGQAIVARAREDPVGTYATNAIGTANLLEAVRERDHVAAILVVTSDKVYRPRGAAWLHREDDPLGGPGPYGMSKTRAELVTREVGASRTGLASLRAGNAIGGGDWGRARLVCDVLRALEEGQQPIIRRPRSVRPWQHVLDPLAGYLMAAEHRAESARVPAETWNFGPDAASEISAHELARETCRLWGWRGDVRVEEQPPDPSEPETLRLDSTKAWRQLGWRPRWDIGEALGRTVEWRRRVGAGEDARATSLAQIHAYGENHAQPGEIAATA